MHHRDDRRPGSFPPLPAFFEPPEQTDDDLDRESPARLSDEALAALVPDDDYEPAPEPHDFWIDAED